MTNYFAGQTDVWTLLTTAGLAVVTVLTRSFFFISKSDWSIPTWAQRGLQYAPIAALSAVIAPEILMSQGQVISTLQDARLYGVLAGVAFFIWRRGSAHAVLGTIVSGMAIYLPLHIGWGW
jgi:branched-subunit amino acid transport protein